MTYIIINTILFILIAILQKDILTVLGIFSVLISRSKRGSIVIISFYGILCSILFFVVNLITIIALNDYSYIKYCFLLLIIPFCLIILIIVLMNEHNKEYKEELEKNFEEIIINKFKKDLLCRLKAKDELINIRENSESIEVKDVCEINIKNFDPSINRLEEEVKLNGDKYKEPIDDYIKYMKDKISDIKGYSEKEHPMKDIMKEKSIQQIVEAVLKVMKPEATENLLNTAKERLETLDKYKEIVDTYNSKIVSKNSYGNKHASEIQEYNKAKKMLESIEINNWDDYEAVKSQNNKYSIINFLHYRNKHLYS